MSLCLFFFFQAEDGIRDVAVTGVQTCALPISVRPAPGDEDARHDQDEQGDDHEDAARHTIHVGTLQIRYQPITWLESVEGEKVLRRNYMSILARRMSWRGMTLSGRCSPSMMTRRVI